MRRKVTNVMIAHMTKTGYYDTRLTIRLITTE
jgi:hypothetical protein